MMKKLLAAGLTVGLLAASLPSPSRAEDDATDPMSESSVLRDPDIPVLGNPDGDVTIVEYYDYQCPYCRKVHPDLAQVVRDDGRVRLVFKDWPIFGGPSIYAAKLTLAAQYQGKFAEAHEALITLHEKLTETSADTALSAAGIDLARAKTDLAAHRDAIDAVLTRNREQALGFGFRGTPAFIVGHFRVPGALKVEAFKQAISDARSAAKQSGDR